MKNHLTTIFYGMKDREEFIKGIQSAINQFPPTGIFTGDNLIAINRNLGFLDDVHFMDAFMKNTSSEHHPEHEQEISIIWRTHTLAWAAFSSLRLEGDFVECACYRGRSAKILCDYLDFNQTGKSYYLYDLFEHDEGMNHHSMPSHGSKLYNEVKQRFYEYPKVHVIQGSVPGVLQQSAPDKIAFMHLDLNNAEAEIGALELLFERIVPGGMIVLDDYGWLAYRPQKLAEDNYFSARGYRVLELPTGQGLVIK